LKTSENVALGRKMPFVDGHLLQLGSSHTTIKPGNKFAFTVADPVTSTPKQSDSSTARCAASNGHELPDQNEPVPLDSDDDRRHN
jgi:hypothetical protein